MEDLRIAVGHDSRLSAEPLKKAVVGALMGCGVHAVDCGLASTPAMFMSTIFEETKAHGSIMITASHLPFNRNGLKFFTAEGGLSKEDILTILKEGAKTEVKPGLNAKGEHFPLIERYAEFLREKIIGALKKGERPLEGMHIVVDAANGAGGFFVSQVLEPLGADTRGSLLLEPDGSFPCHAPNPEDKKAMEYIRNALVASHADLGLIFDTDVDRMGAVLKSGEAASRNTLIALVSAILAPDYPGSTIVTDSVTSDELTWFLTDELGLKHLRFKRGYRNVIDECKRLNSMGEVSPLAIETSGHGALRENYYLDDGAYLGVMLIIAATKAKEQGKDLESLIEKLGQPAESKEYRLQILSIRDFRSYGEAVLKNFAHRAEMEDVEVVTPSYEGVRLAFPKGWALLRLSLHEPCMVLNIETREAGGANHILAKVRDFLTGFGALDLGNLN